MDAGGIYLRVTEWIGGIGSNLQAQGSRGPFPPARAESETTLFVAGDDEINPGVAKSTYAMRKSLVCCSGQEHQARFPAASAAGVVAAGDGTVTRGSTGLIGSQ